jgi:hypothetical protein
MNEAPIMPITMHKAMNTSFMKYEIVASALGAVAPDALKRPYEPALL